MSPTAKTTTPTPTTTTHNPSLHYTLAELQDMQPIGRPIPAIPGWESYRLDCRAVDSVPPPKPVAPPTFWDRLRDAARGPAVRAARRLRDFEGAYYTVDAHGRTIETVVARGERKSVGSGRGV
jgi:hypothetical protein